MKRYHKALSLIVTAVMLFTLAACAGGGADTAAFDAYRSERRMYLDLFDEGENAAKAGLTALDALVYDETLSEAENITAVDRVVSEALDALAAAQSPAYDANAVASKYLTDSNTIKGTDILAQIKPKSDYSLNTDAPAYYSNAALAAISAIEDKQLRALLLQVDSVDDIYSSAMLSMREGGDFILTDHFTELGAQLAAELGIQTKPLHPYATRGTYTVAPDAADNTNVYSIRGAAEKRELSLALNISNGDIYRADIFRHESFSPYTIMDALPNMSAGYPEEKFEEGVHGTKLANVRYGEEEREVMDIFVPKSLSKENENGVILFVHGGSWTSGDKADMEKLCTYYTKLGYVTVTMNHTYVGGALKSGETGTFYTINNEVELAFAKIKQLSEENGWSITQAAISGYSSGCHVAFLYAYSKGNEASAPIPVKCAFGMVGTMDFRDMCWQNVAIPGPGVAAIGLNDMRLSSTDDPYPQEQFDQIIDSISPLAFAKKGDAVPTVAGFGETDYLLVDYLHGVYLDQALDEQNIENEVIFFPNSDHAMGTNPGCGELYRTYAEQLLKKHFGY